MSEVNEIFTVQRKAFNDRVDNLSFGFPLKIKIGSMIFCFSRGGRRRGRTFPEFFLVNSGIQLQIFSFLKKNMIGKRSRVWLVFQETPQQEGEKWVCICVFSPRSSDEAFRFSKFFLGEDNGAFQLPRRLKTIMNHELRR